ncbi:iron chelate uptake ABC transporter family permease subunit [Roseibium sp. RKSG952]|uniref:iron chelate uptake ABC transporter family permease subunit n=1 Tax=Roseibium sp. RKSG952 TaxID=2529384 RepID=UPI001AD923F4
MPTKLLVGLSLAFALICIAYMTVDAKAGWDFILPFRGTKLLALVVVGVAVSTATVLFQTISGNQILTPSIMGFDALYVLILTGSVYALGGLVVADLAPIKTFLITGSMMVAVSLLLFGSLLLDKRQDLFRMILTGVILATLFRSLTSFLQRIIDPNEFAFIQVASYARFNDLSIDTLAIAAPLTALAVVTAWSMRFRLDVLMLGRNISIGLGENPHRGYLMTLLLVAVLVSVSTALVGPVAFLGLLVVSLARFVLSSPYHSHLLPVAALISAITLVGGQLLMERVFRLVTPLSVVIDLVGGLVFLTLILKSLRR